MHTVSLTPAEADTLTKLVAPQLEYYATLAANPKCSIGNRTNYALFKELAAKLKNHEQPHAD